MSMTYFLAIITKTLKAGLLISAAQLFMFSGCNKNGTTPCANGGYAFAVTSDYAPQREIYNVGDTIFLNSIFSKTLTDQINTSIVVDYGNSVGIGGDIAVYYLDTITHQPVPAKDSFQFVSQVGSFIERSGNSNSGINIIYSETSSNYQFRGAIVCKKRGIYGFSVANLMSNGIRGKNCTNAGFNMTVTNTDKHLYLHQYALNVNPNDPYLQQKGYDFRVQ